MSLAPLGVQLLHLKGAYQLKGHMRQGKLMGCQKDLASDKPVPSRSDEDRTPSLQPSNWDEL